MKVLACFVLAALLAISSAAPKVRRYVTGTTLGYSGLSYPEGLDYSGLGYSGLGYPGLGYPGYGQSGLGYGYPYGYSSY